MLDIAIAGAAALLSVIGWRSLINTLEYIEGVNEPGRRRK